MARIEIGGLGIAYDIVGDGERAAAITPGGRFSRETPGVRALAERLAAGGMRVLIWDRPNCGASDISFEGASESVQNADTLAGLLQALGLGPALLVGGSGGARDSLLCAVRHPEAVSRLFLLWISGGPVGLVNIASFYYADSAVAASAGGMQAVAELAGWKEQIALNPGNRDRLLAQDVAGFIARMQLWAGAFFPQEGAPMPGVAARELATLDRPAMILRSGVSDVHHPRETSEAVHALLPRSSIAEPPWGDREWMERLAAAATGAGLFERWPLLAEQILAFAAA